MRKINIYIYILQSALFLLLIVICLLILPPTAFSQNEGIGINIAGNPANPKALLDIDAAGLNIKAGLLIPRMNNEERNTILSPIPESLLIFNTDIHCFEAFYNGAWVSFGCLSVCLIPESPTADINTYSQTKIVWKWNPVSGASGYKWSTSTTYGSATDIGISTTYTQTNLTCNSSYTLYVWSYNVCGNSSATALTQSTPICCTATSDCGGLTTMTDSRDNKVYNIVQIGTQCWFKQNLDYGTYVTASTGQRGAGTQKYCYLNNSLNCNKYGGFYEWAELMTGSSGCNGIAACPPCNSAVQGICPEGWHIPSHYEWTLLEKNVGSTPGALPYDETTIGSLGTNEGDNLKTTTGWMVNSGTNSSGFSALGIGVTFGGSFFYQLSNGLMDNGFWWTSTEFDSSNAWYHCLAKNSSASGREHGPKLDGMNLRCIKN